MWSLSNRPSEYNIYLVVHFVYISHSLNRLKFNIKWRETSKATHPTIFWRKHWKQSAIDSFRDVFTQLMYTHTSWATLNMIAKSFAIMLTLFFFWTFSQETFPVKHTTQQWWSMRKPTSHKKTAESTGYSSFTDWPKKKFLANQKQAIQMFLELFR